MALDQPSATSSSASSDADTDADSIELRIERERKLSIARKASRIAWKDAFGPDPVSGPRRIRADTKATDETALQSNSIPDSNTDSDVTTDTSWRIQYCRVLWKARHNSIRVWKEDSPGVDETRKSGKIPRFWPALMDRSCQSGAPYPIQPMSAALCVGGIGECRVQPPETGVKADGKRKKTEEEELKHKKIS